MYLYVYIYSSILNNYSIIRINILINHNKMKNNNPKFNINGF